MVGLVPFSKELGCTKDKVGGKGQPVSEEGRGVSQAQWQAVEAAGGGQQGCVWHGAGRRSAPISVLSERGAAAPIHVHYHQGSWTVGSLKFFWREQSASTQRVP